ncbi:MAG: hypothetical protein AAB336_07190 [Acidobacteriota bacterium]
MKPKEISQIIEKEINGDWSISNAHGCDLKKCLVHPRKLIYKDLADDAIEHELWLVLEEMPETTIGYQIVFDEITKAFGLGMDGDIFLGIYGTFLDTFDAM